MLLTGRISLRKTMMMTTITMMMMMTRMAMEMRLMLSAMITKMTTSLRNSHTGSMKSGQKDGPSTTSLSSLSEGSVWTSLATGRYPEDHGITGDIMYNLKSKEFFNRSDPESRRQEDWWSDTNPFWSTAS